MAYCVYILSIYDRVMRVAYISLQEYQENESSLAVEGGEISQTVNLYSCKNTTIHVKGKVNAVTLGE